MTSHWLGASLESTLQCLLSLAKTLLSIWWSLSSDLAVGAPFEGNGAIYIFRGSPDGIREKYSQRIAASDLLSARPLESFGYSISGGNDMDGNQYPDIIVGAYESNKVIALRSRPVVNIVSAMRSEPTLIDSKKTNCESGNDGKNCFKLQVCFRWEG